MPDPQTADFLALLKTELSEVMADVRSIEAYIQWRGFAQKLAFGRRKEAKLRSLLSTYEGN